MCLARRSGLFTERYHIHSAFLKWIDKEYDNKKSTLDLGYSSNCDGMGVHDLKPVDFNVENLPEGRSQTQYFIVCVPEKTEEDRQAR